MSKLLRIGFIGAGGVNFGGKVGPWDHASRLEKLDGIEIVAIADVDTSKAEQALEERKRGPCTSLYANCKIYASSYDMIERERLDAVFIGLPPSCHGSLVQGLDIELACVRAGIHAFIEKPVSVFPPDEFSDFARAIVAEQAKSNAIISVGYMFRYHPAVVQMKEILADFYSAGKRVTCINARYNCAYTESGKSHWWNARLSGGPIVEQATHFCDLARYLAGEPVFETISALAVKPWEPAGKLSHISGALRENEINEDLRIPRATSAHWKFQRNGLGCLMHGISLHGTTYEASLDVWADGLRMSLIEPYAPTCQLRVRTGDIDSERIFTYEGADPYLEEDRVFLEAIRSGNPSLVKSSYSDAVKTYEFTWAIRRASEMND